MQEMKFFTQFDLLDGKGTMFFFFPLCEQLFKICFKKIRAGGPECRRRQAGKKTTFFIEDKHKLSTRAAKRADDSTTRLN